MCSFTKGISLTDLHDGIQEVMGWWNSHLHQFVYQRKRYGVPDPDWDFDKIIDDRPVAIRDLGLSIKNKILYEYDFGGEWEHELFLEKILTAEGRMPPVSQSSSLLSSGGLWRTLRI